MPRRDGSNDKDDRFWTVWIFDAFKGYGVWDGPYEVGDWTECFSFCLVYLLIPILVFIVGLILGISMR